MTKLTEEEMRHALFGVSYPVQQLNESQAVMPSSVNNVVLSNTRRRMSPSSPKLRVTLRVTKEFEGNEEILTYDANTLSSLMAEIEAKKDAKKRKYRYSEVISIHPV